MSNLQVVSDATTPEKPAEEKRRVITLTNRRPISILESEWPVIAKGGGGEDNQAHPIQWSIQVRVREWAKNAYCTHWYRAIVHATFKLADDIDERWQTIRVGHLIDHTDATGPDIVSELNAIANEMRERIEDKHYLREVTLAFDRCFEELGPLQL